MLTLFIWYSSYFFIAYVAYNTLTRKTNPMDALFLIGVSLIPIGKLFYTPGLGLVSVTAAFIFTTVVSGFGLLVSFINGVERYVFVPFLAVFPALFSILFLFAPSQSLWVASAANAASAGSPLLRVVSVFFTCIYCSYVLMYVARHADARREVATFYINATLFATFLGVLIAVGLYFGILGRGDVIPVSVEDVHMAGRFYRFNPGASVNEFGEILGYAIFLLQWTGWSSRKKMICAAIMLLAEFFSLTRGAWLGLVVGYIVYALFSTPRNRAKIIMAAGVLIGFLLVVVSFSDDLTFLLVSRTALADSPGGNDRLNTAAAVFDLMSASPWRALFGYGWAADIFSLDYGFDKVGYIHSVPLMFLFDTGLVGVSFCAMVFITLGKFAYDNLRQDFDMLAGIVAFMFAVSAVEHIFYHVQTWLIFGLILGLTFRAAQARRVAQAAGRALPVPDSIPQEQPAQ